MYPKGIKTKSSSADLRAKYSLSQKGFKSAAWAKKSINKKTNQDANTVVANRVL